MAPWKALEAERTIEARAGSKPRGTGQQPGDAVLQAVGRWPACRSALTRTPTKLGADGLVTLMTAQRQGKGAGFGGVHHWLRGGVFPHSQAIDEVGSREGVGAVGRGDHPGRARSVLLLRPQPSRVRRVARVGDPESRFIGEIPVADRLGRGAGARAFERVGDRSLRAPGAWKPREPGAELGLSRRRAGDLPAGRGRGPPDVRRRRGHGPRAGGVVVVPRFSKDRTGRGLASPTWRRSPGASARLGGRVRVPARGRRLSTSSRRA